MYSHNSRWGIRRTYVNDVHGRRQNQEQAFSFSVGPLLGQGSGLQFFRMLYGFSWLAFRGEPGKLRPPIVFFLLFFFHIRSSLRLDWKLSDTNASTEISRVGVSNHRLKFPELLRFSWRSLRFVFLPVWLQRETLHPYLEKILMVHMS